MRPSCCVYVTHVVACAVRLLISAAVSSVVRRCGMGLFSTFEYSVRCLSAFLPQFVALGAVPPGASPWSLPLWPSVDRVQPTAEYFHQLAGIFRVNCDLHQLSPGIIVGQMNGFISVILSEICWANLLREMCSLWHPSLSPKSLKPVSLTVAHGRRGSPSPSLDAAPPTDAFDLEAPRPFRSALQLR